MSIVTVPVLGLASSYEDPGHVQGDPRAIISGVAITTSKSNQPSLISQRGHLSPTKFAPAAFASFREAPRAKQEHVKFTVPFGKYHCATDLLVSFFNVDVRCKQLLQLHRISCKVVSFASATASSTLYAFVLSIFSRAARSCLLF